MWHPGLIAIVFLVAAVLLGGASYAGAPLLFALPFVLVVFGVATMGAFGGQQALRKRRHHSRMRRFRQQAKAQKSDFTAEDKQTLV